MCVVGYVAAAGWFSMHYGSMPKLLVDFVHKQIHDDSEVRYLVTH